MFRAVYNFRHPKERRIGTPGKEEEWEAIKWLLQQDQSATSQEEISTLKGKRGTNLMFSWDNEEKLLRIFGRLKSENLSREEREPIFLKREGKIAPLLARYAHRKTLHGGTQLMMQFLRARYWIHGLRSLVKTIPLRCPRCFRHRMKASEQLMANLPASRTTPAHSFEVCGVDYAGPVLLRNKLGRAPTLYKAWIAVFVCYVTRAVHLELVSDATAEAFIAALRRMVSRRGMIREMHSDNGGNFVKANKEIRKLFDGRVHYEREFGLKWNFTPPSAPHYGGMFEAAVKSMKHHLKRVIEDRTLTFEEYATVLCQVEACLNSRPLGALHDDDNEMPALPPAHFLTGRQILTLPETGNLIDVPKSRLNRWELAQQDVQNFWDRWKNEYVLNLIHRTKWKGLQRNVEVGDVVIVKEDNTPPSRWWMARVVEVYPGSDGLVRTVKIRHRGNDYLRPIRKLGVLIPVSEQGASKEKEIEEQGAPERKNNSEM